MCFADKSGLVNPISYTKTSIINEKRDELLERVESVNQWSPELGDFIINYQCLLEIIKEAYSD